MQISPPARGEGSLVASLRHFLFLAVVAVIVPAASGATYSIAGFSDTAVAQGLSGPTDFDFLPDGRMLILEKGGIVRIVVRGVV
jgi:glucose/arabinose dehydrogenase